MVTFCIDGMYAVAVTLTQLYCTKIKKGNTKFVFTYMYSTAYMWCHICTHESVNNSLHSCMPFCVWALASWYLIQILVWNGSHIPLLATRAYRYLSKCNVVLGQYCMYILALWFILFACTVYQYTVEKYLSFSQLHYENIYINRSHD